MRKLALIGLLVLFVAPASASASAPRLGATQDAWPIWSPDGQMIAFTRIYSANRMELELVDLRTRRVTKVAQNGFQLLPSWSRDGSRLAYQAGGSVYVADVQGGSTGRIGPGAAPAFSPAGALARVVGGLLYVGAGAPLTGFVIGRPAWSLDGGSIAFRRDDGIYTTDCCIPGTARLLVGASNPGDPVYSPDGTQVAFTIGSEVWVASRGLVPAHAIARAKPDAGTPSWSPAGDAVVYTWRGGVTRTTLGGRSTLLHAPAGPGVALSSSGRLAYAGPRARCPGHLAIVVDQPVTGSCAISGTARADVIEGTGREGDVILAGAGNDQVHADDGHTDRIDCGAGRDTVWADRSDHLTGCETVYH